MPRAAAIKETIQLKFDHSGHLNTLQGWCFYNAGPELSLQQRHQSVNTFRSWGKGRGGEGGGSHS